MNWMFGKNGYINHKITGDGIGGQLSQGTMATINANSTQAFYDIHQACIRGRDAATRGADGSTFSVSLNGPSAEGGRLLGGKVLTSIATVNVTETTGKFGINFAPPQVTPGIGGALGLSGSLSGASVLSSNRSGYSGDKIALSVPIPAIGSFNAEIGDEGYWGIGLTLEKAAGVSGSLTFVPGASGCR